jgi:hypothetical protein
MLVRRSTLTFVFVAAGVFILGSSFVVYHRPQYIPSNVIPQKWLDWSGLGSDHSDIPLPAGDGNTGGNKQPGPGAFDPAVPRPPAPPVNNPSSSPGHTSSTDDNADGDVHILPISPGDVEVKPLPISSENSQRRPIAIQSPALKERLVALLGAPMPTYSQFIKEGAKRCPSDVADRQVNPDQHAGQLEKWVSMESEELTSRRLGIVQYLERLDKEGKVPLLGNKLRRVEEL